MPKGAKSKREVPDADENFESADSGASQTCPVQCSAIRKSDIVLIKDKPCKVVDMSTSKTGKHGHAKVHLVGLDIFDGKKYEDICPSTHNMNRVLQKTVNYSLMGINDEGFLQLMDDDGDLREDLRCPEFEDKAKDIRIMKEDADQNDKSVQVTVMQAMGMEKVTGSKLTT